jgi:hypothetical protein
MNHNGVNYTVVETLTPGVWRWQFRIGDEVVSGKTETNMELLAMRRAQLRINRALRETEQDRVRKTPELPFGMSEIVVPRLIAD